MAPSPRIAARTVARSLEQHVDIETPEQVVLSYAVAGVGSRAAAAIIDMLICVAAFAALVLGWVGVSSSLRRATLGANEQWAIAIVVIAQFAIIWGYYVLFEILRDGQTPGKRLLGLRVVQESGQGLTPSGAAARNLVRALDMQPGAIYLVGLIAAALSPRGKRLGDIVAGTIVVRERPGMSPLGEAVAADADTPQTRLLTDDELAVLERYVARRQTLDPVRRGALASQLAARFRARLPAGEDRAIGGGSDAAWLLRLNEREQAVRARGRSGSGPSSVDAAVARALVREAAPRWSEFAALVADAQRRGGLRALGEAEVSDFVARYRELATDLARLHTASRGRQLDEAFHLARLVAAGHNLLYRRAGTGLRATARYLGRDVPAEVRRSWRPILLATVLLFGPAIAAFEAVRRHPEMATEMVPSVLIDRADEGVVRARRGQGGYLPPDAARVRGPVMASMIMTNNVQITYITFAFGVTAGIGTLFVLVSNGMGALGAPLGLYASKGILDQIVGFVLPHGVLELTAICIAGGAGFLLATGILLPGARTRRDALVDEGKRAVRLIVASTLILIVAGLIEGNVSPLVWPIAWKAAVSAGTVVLLVAYLVPPRRRAVAA
jgi:uncharacterized membrane protein SpoIIM required for sporulation/uncharacterized RDD family membrane protein YckC